jgi:hypothetical protein
LVSCIPVHILSRSAWRAQAHAFGVRSKSSFFSFRALFACVSENSMRHRLYVAFRRSHTSSDGGSNHDRKVKSKLSLALTIVAYRKYIEGPACAVSRAPGQAGHRERC